MKNSESVAEHKKDRYAVSRAMYILEAAFEYFIDLMVAKSYLAKLAGAIGISPALTGILSSFVSLGCTFSIFAVFLANRRPVKRWIVPLHIIHQLFFAFLYFIPLTGMGTGAKTVLFAVFLLLGYLIANLISSSKINWFMSLVDDSKRGSFTATKEIISLLGSMVFTFVMSAIGDHFEAIGQQNTAFLIIGITIFVLMLLHTATLLVAKEKEATAEQGHTSPDFRALLRNRDVIKIIGVFVLWNMARYATFPFYGTYEIHELGFTLTDLAILNVGYCVLRSAVSPPIGRFADKFSFGKMLTFCFCIEAVSYVFMIFAAPEHGGRVLYIIRFLLDAVAMAGINSGMINLIYDYVKEDQRTGALAVQQALSGIVGFLTTLLVALPVDLIQKNGNTLFGISVYAQQVISVFGVLICGVLLLYLSKVIAKMHRP